LHSVTDPEVQVATTRQRNSDSTTQSEASPRSVKQTDAAPTPRDVAEESAAIYPDTFNTPPTPEQIAAEAYNIYCARGCGDGAAVDDWLEAERRLSGRRMGQGGADTAR
jgi:hypothetical protein